MLEYNFDIARGAKCSSLVRAFALGKCYPVCWMMHINEHLLLIRKISPCGGSMFRLSLSEWYTMSDAI